MQIDSDNFFHAIFYHLRREEVRLALPLHGHLPHVLEQDRSNGLRRTGQIQLNLSDL